MEKIAPHKLRSQLIAEYNKILNGFGPALKPKIKSALQSGYVDGINSVLQNIHKLKEKRG